ncbi:Uncharacterized protein OS=Saccharothrix espanaensis (strain ATCC 51144 / DSM 44229 / JCM 9112 / NBRC 15066 / NRRL 15764) GN=BN6_50230 PE=4 SV=1 [Gemmata massiliana]|uniref:Uncharacterized protein n=1 Tax=Gemmata massiliana TaxID=1210884 RepID=A0A6P2D0J7_9BACT|nr:hypothetical protein [Gemmata massiliana]VTR94633.1 Uncharacterized protein OS=Saccharothrix espanaensis (strain ATCC 51144 / DSM 44229 / JCM 9112 / NBRC 15066 / NRRL 15764) GN=BN6_50230 PE=4 SV=1 [Gemmata massiliana]
MLTLDDPRWFALRTSRTSRPEQFLSLLVELRNNPAPDGRAFDSLAQHLWPQFDVEETTLAALPHLVVALERIPAGQRAETLEQIGTIAGLISEADWLSAPDDVRLAYDRAVKDALALALESLREVQDADGLLWVFAAVAALKGCSALCNTLLGLSRQIGECPECGEEIDLQDVCRHW